MEPLKFRRWIPFLLFITFKNNFRNTFESFFLFNPPPLAKNFSKPFPSHSDEKKTKPANSILRTHLEGTFIMYNIFSKSSSRFYFCMLFYPLGLGVHNNKKQKNKCKIMLWYNVFWIWNASSFSPSILTFHGTRYVICIPSSSFFLLKTRWQGPFTCNLCYDFGTTPKPNSAL